MSAPAKLRMPALTAGRPLTTQRLEAIKPRERVRYHRGGRDDIASNAKVPFYAQTCSAVFSPAPRSSPKRAAWS
jgi:hypothetical protein